MEDDWRFCPRFKVKSNIVRPIDGKFDVVGEVEANIAFSKFVKLVESPMIGEDVETLGLGADLSQRQPKVFIPILDRLFVLLVNAVHLPIRNSSPCVLPSADQS